MLYFAEESSGIAGLFSALGLNVSALLLNGIAFLVVVWVLGKFVYPHLVKALDAKKDELEAAAHLEREAKHAMEQAEAKAAEVLASARASADEIISAAHNDAAEQLEAARKKAEAQAERIVAEAREQLERDIQVAREELRAETAKLVATATETVLEERMDDKKDAALIGRSLEVR